LILDKETYVFYSDSVYYDYRQEHLYMIDAINKVLSMLENFNMINAQDMIYDYNIHLIARNPRPLIALS